MKRAPEWTPAEFDLLLQNPSLSDSALTKLLPKRSESAIQVVRSGVHEFHIKEDSTLLSKMMKTRLAREGMNLLCPICGEKI